MKTRALFCLVASLFLVSVLATAQTITVSSLSPSSVYVNSAGFTLTVTGTGFAQGDTVIFNSNSLTTSYISSTQLTAQVPASLVATYSNTAYVYVTSSTTSSNSVSFYVVALNPSISLSPPSVVQGSTPNPITIYGNNNNSFMNGATVQWNGRTVPSTYVNASQIQFTPTAQQLGPASMTQITVTNPAPGGLSNAVDLDVTYKETVSVVDLPANDIVWDPYAQVIYASVPSSYGPNGNSIAVIRPRTGRVTAYHFVGSEPNQLALSADSKYLYVGLNGNGSVQRLLLPNFTPDIDVSLGTNQFGGVNVANGLQVSPSDDHTWAVISASASCCGDTVYFYADSTQLASSVNNFSNFSQIVFPTSSTMYAYYNGTVSQIDVTSTGGTLGTQWNGLVNGSAIAYDSGLIYGGQGEVLNTATGLLVGTYDVNGSCCGSSTLLLPDAAFNRVFAVGNTPFSPSFGITAYNLAEFTPVASADLSQFNGATAASFIAWGNSGLAFISQNGSYPPIPLQLVLVASNTMLEPSGPGKNPKPSPTSLSPNSVTHGSWNFPLTVKGTNFVPGASVSWNGISLTTSYISSTQLVVYVPYSDVASAGKASVVVANPTPGGGMSSPLSFSIK
jgi:hypothetical protein